MLRIAKIKYLLRGKRPPNGDTSHGGRVCDGGRLWVKVTVEWRKKIASTGEKNCVDWRVAGETPALFAEQSAFGGCLAAQCSQVNRKSYHRLAFRRRDACALCGAKRLRRLPGCAAFTLPLKKLPSTGVSQARRLLSWLRCVLPSSEKVTVDWRVAGETPALFAEQSAFGGCLAALRSPFLRESYRRLAGRRRDACSSGCAVGGFSCGWGLGGRTGWV